MCMEFVDPYIGQESLRHYLTQLRHANTLGQAHLWIGPEHVGKRTLMTNLLFQWLCTRPREDKPCGKCSACMLLRSDQHPNIHWLNGEEGSISIEVIREVVGNAAQSRLHLGPYVIIINQADALSMQAANAILKLLEEPHERVYLFLLTAHVERILPTIQSRCTIFYFSPVEDVVMNAFTTEKEIVCLAHGLPGVLKSWSKVKERQQMHKELLLWLNIFTAKSLTERLRFLDPIMKTTKNARSVQRLLAVAQCICRDVLLLQCACPSGTVFVNEQTALQKLAERTTIHESIRSLMLLARLNLRVSHVQLQMKLLLTHLAATIYRPL